MVVVVVVVAQPHMYAYACAHVTEPKHLPLDTEGRVTGEKVHPVTNFKNQSLEASLVK